MAAIILMEKVHAESIADVYREREMRKAELTAKKELCSISNAIDAAAAKGLYEYDYKVTSAITRLADDYYAVAKAIIDADIAEAGYNVTEVLKGNRVTNYKLSWKAEDEEEQQGGENEPVNPADEPTPAEVQDPERYTIAPAVLEESNPSAEGWFVLVDGVYYPTTDTEVAVGRTYYKLNDPQKEEPVEP